MKMARYTENDRKLGSQKEFPSRICSPTPNMSMSQIIFWATSERCQKVPLVNFGGMCQMVIQIIKLVYFLHPHQDGPNVSL